MFVDHQQHVLSDELMAKIENNNLVTFIKTHHNRIFAYIRQTTLMIFPKYKSTHLDNSQKTISKEEVLSSLSEFNKKYKEGTLPESNKTSLSVKIGLACIGIIACRALYYCYKTYKKNQSKKQEQNQSKKRY